MNVSALKAGVRYLGGWFALVFFVVLLTTIFSFLGTIICAVLAGMMMGAAKHQRWQSVPVAVVFPTVIFTLLRSTRAELLGRQVMVLSLLCFGAFWLTYLVTSLLLVFESKKPLTLPVAGAAPTQSKPAAPQALPESSAAGIRPARAPLSVADLQGQWRQPMATRNGDSPERLLEVSGDLIKLRVAGGPGRSRDLAQAVLSLSEPSSAESGRTIDPTSGPGTRSGEVDTSHPPPGAAGEPPIG